MKAVGVEWQFRDEGEAAGAFAHPAVRSALHHSHRLDPMHRPPDGAIRIADLGGLRDIPDLTLQVMQAAPHPETQAVVVAAVTKALHGDGRTLGLPPR